MSAETSAAISLGLPCRESCGEVLVAALERAAGLFGLQPREAAALSRAARLLFLLCCPAGKEREQVQAVITGHPWGLELRFRLDAANGELAGAVYKALECGPDPAAARTCCLPVLEGVDRFRCERPHRGGVDFILEQHRSFAQTPLPEVGQVAPPFHGLENPTPELLGEACARVLALTPRAELPSFLHNPARFAALNVGGRLCCSLVADAAGQPAALLCWERYGPHHALFFGPYLCGQCPAPRVGEAARAVVERFLCQAAAAGLRGVLGGVATELLPGEYFDVLGRVPYVLGNGARRPVAVPYRQLREDNGGMVWVHHDLEPFLRNEYSRLAFVRELRPLPEFHAAMAEHALFFLDLRPGLQEAVLTPITPGRDAAEALRGLSASLQQRGLRDLFLHLDLAEAAQVALFPALTAAGFTPVFLVPGADRADHVVLHHALS